METYLRFSFVYLCPFTKITPLGILTLFLRVVRCFNQIELNCLGVLIKERNTD